MPQEMNFEDAQAAPGHVASTDGLGPLVEAAMISADEYGEAASHAECWTGTRTAYNEHLAAAKAKVESAVVAAVVAERERCARIVERINGWTGTREVAAEIRGETQVLRA